MSKMKLRPVTAEDKELLFTWANDKATRASSVNRHTITKEEHEQWFHAHFNSENCHMFIYEYDGEAVGQVRVNIEGRSGEIGYSVAPNHRGQGHGRNILQLVEQYEYGKLDKLVAKVRKTNIASQYAFVDTGWTEDEFVSYEKTPCVSNITDFHKAAWGGVKDGKRIALVIGAGRESIYAIETAKQMGYYVIAFDGREAASGLNHADESHVADIKNPKSIINCLCARRPTCVVPVPIGRWLITAGKINDYYQLKGVGEEVCNKCTDKYLFHSLLAAEGCRNVECHLLKAGMVVEEFSMAFPVVLKPRYGSGSRAVSVFADKEELRKYLKEAMPFEEDMLVESLFAGQEYGVDGFVLDGDIDIVLVRKKEITKFPARQCLGYFAVSRDEDPILYEKVQKHFEKITKTMEMRDCVFHSDIILNGNEIFNIETSPRLSGHNLHDCFTIISSGIDIVDVFLKYMAGMAFEKKYKYGHFLIHYFSFENCVIKHVPPESILWEKYPLVRYECNLHVGDYMEPIMDGHLLMKRGYFILEADSEKSLYGFKDALLKEFGVSNS